MDALRRTPIHPTFRDALSAHLTISTYPFLLCAIILIEIILVSTIPSLLRSVLLPAKSQSPPAFSGNRAFWRMQVKVEKRKGSPEAKQQQSSNPPADENKNPQDRLLHERSIPFSDNRGASGYILNGTALEESRLISHHALVPNLETAHENISTVRQPQRESHSTRLAFYVRNAFNQAEKNGAIYWTHLKKSYSQAQHPAEPREAGQASTAHAKRENNEGNDQRQARRGSNNKKQKTQRDDENDNSGDDQGDGRRAPGGSSNALASTTSLFRCPFAASDPHKYPQCLVKYELKRIADVVQHLERCHVVHQQSYCPRCWVVFEELAQCISHVAAKGCTKKPRSPGLWPLLASDIETIKAVMKCARGAENKWNKMWKAIFNKSPPKSPYNLQVIPAVRGVLERDFEAALSNELSDVARSWLSSIDEGDNLRALLPRMKSDIMRMFVTATPTRPQWPDLHPATLPSPHRIENTVVGGQVGHIAGYKQNTAGETVYINDSKGHVESYAPGEGVSVNLQNEFGVFSRPDEQFLALGLLDRQNMNISEGAACGRVSGGLPQDAGGLNQQDAPQLMHTSENKDRNFGLVSDEQDMDKWGFVGRVLRYEPFVQEDSLDDNGYVSPGELLDMYERENNDMDGAGRAPMDTYSMEHDYGQGGYDE